MEAFTTLGDYDNVVHHGLEAETIECLSALDRSGDDARKVSDCFRPEIGKTHEEFVCPSLKASIAMKERGPIQLLSHPKDSVSVFVAVFSERSSGWRRNKVRSMWRRAREISGNAVTVKFVLCKHTASGELPWTTHNIEVESERDDVEMVDCDDGDITGGKTRKLVSIMSTYADKYRNDFFMKVEDDTFIAWRRYAKQLVTKGHPNMFMGLENTDTKPCRDSNSRLYEPLWTFDDAVYPRSMSAAAGYTLGRDLVDLVLNTGVGRNKILFNEEGAIGVWMKLAMEMGHNVEFINIHGVDKYWEWDYRHPLTAFSTWGSYPHVAHAGLAADTIECLSAADGADTADRQIAECFKAELGKTYASTACSSTDDHRDVAPSSQAVITHQPNQQVDLLHAVTEKALSQEEDLTESVFVAVFSRRSATWRRDKIRAMWQNAKAASGENVTVKFSVCVNPAEDEEKYVNDTLTQELSKGDLALLDCDEGYGKGALTRKLLASMKMYVEHYDNKYFMKIDDDTFIYWKKYVQTLKAKGTPRLYMGVEIGEAKVCRNESYLWYEPFETFKEDVFPKGMSGGSGYTLGRDLVDIIIKTDLGRDHILYNEDRSVGLWMQHIEGSGKNVTHVGFNGIDGFWAWEWGRPQEAFSTWGNYDHVVFHGIEADTIECLAQMEAANDESKPVGDCMKAENGKTHQPLVCAHLADAPAPDIGQDAIALTSTLQSTQISEDAQLSVTVPDMQVATASGNTSAETALSIFVAVFSRRSSTLVRDKIRGMWEHARSFSGENVIVKYAVCKNKAEDETADVEITLKEEESKGDLALLDCDEGYGKGALTRKLLAAMKLYTETYKNDYFFKIDDDTFISWKKYVELLKAKGSRRLYMGIEIGEGKPCRDESYLWYEPFDTFKEDVFPPGMSGGSGYTIGRDLVDIIVKTDLGVQNILYNEDRSVGLWMRAIEQSGKEVDHVGITGIDGFWAWDWESPLTAFSTWNTYQQVVFHGLEAETIECLAGLDIADDGTKQMGDCFKAEVGRVHEQLVCASLNTGNELTTPQTQDTTSLLPQADDALGMTALHTPDATSDTTIAVDTTSLPLPPDTTTVADTPVLQLTPEATSNNTSVVDSMNVSVFVAVFARREKGSERRDRIRAMWEHAKNASGSNINVKFAICKGPPEGEDPGLVESLNEEATTKGDLALLDCDEGYGGGALTKKLLASMEYYVDNFENSYFMKIDDDTFISWKRYVHMINTKGHPLLYMGIEIGEGKPCRNESYLWYEPYETFAEAVFPRGMSGGSGYTLGRHLIEIIVRTGLGKSNILYNEDRSVGQWCKLMEESGTDVQHVGFDGIDGFWAWDWQNPTQAFSTWGAFDKVVFHGLHAETIECLAELDVQDDGSKDMNSCFQAEVGEAHPKLECASMNKDSSSDTEAKQEDTTVQAKLLRLQLDSLRLLTQGGLKTTSVSDLTGQLLPTSTNNVSVFVSVFSRRSDVWRRNKIRPMWRRAQSVSGDGVTVKFALCSRGEPGEKPYISQNLREEMKSGDVQMVDCDEGTSSVGQTKKLLAVLSEYVVLHRNDYFMKIEDDTFISWTRYVRWLTTKGNPRIYMGVEVAEAVPIRDEHLQFYEPYWTYPNRTFPKCMAGGSGYTLGRDLADIIVKTGLGQAKLLFNEDRAVGVWMKSIANSGKNVDYVGLPGVDGFWSWDWQHPVQAYSTFKEYPFVVHHGITGDSIECLALLDSKNDETQPIGECLKSEEGKFYERLVSAMRRQA
eukprot:TRINITY_DN553_c0_g1_i3.p1 TRINITY_DN553_c0_g1~~TRINITY_DN553_c0_g1_i3.p1  ORF type:complete len:2029 (-),score=310.97 TRINITY_DN553_c0_g1_i3:34-5280(-)